MKVFCLRQKTKGDSRKMTRPLEYLVMFTVAATETVDEGEESLIVLVAWQIVSLAKNQVGAYWGSVPPSTCAVFYLPRLSVSLAAGGSS